MTGTIITSLVVLIFFYISYITEQQHSDEISDLRKKNAEKKINLFK